MSTPIPQRANPAVFPIAEEFMRLTYDLLGAYLDALAGLVAVREQLLRYQCDQIEKLKKSDLGNACEQFMDEQSFSHEFAEANHAPEKLLHRTTQGEFKERIALRGLDARLLGYMMVALLFGYWEDEYREKFALALGYTNKNDIKDDLFGDLCKLRNAVIHNRGIATKEVENAKILRWFKRQEQMFISSEHVDFLLDQIDAYATRLCGIPVQSPPTA
jgi:hypothetical protein